MGTEQNSGQKEIVKSGENKLYRNDLTEIVFEGRNKEFGGYMLRRQYERRLLIATCIGITLLTILIIPQGVAYLWPDNNVNSIIEDSIVQIPLGGPDYSLAIKPPPPLSQTTENEKLAPEPVTRNDTANKNKQTVDTTVNKNKTSDNKNNQANGQQNGLKSNNNGGGGTGGNNEKGKTHAGIINLRQIIKLQVTEYPMEERLKGHEDIILVGWKVHKDGSTSDFVIAQSKGYPKLNEAAIRIVQRAHCYSATNNGEPIDEAISMKVTFRQ